MSSSISWYDELLGHDWVRFARLSSKASCLTALCCSLLSLLYSGSVRLFLADLLLFALLALWDFPFMYQLCVPVERFSEIQAVVLQGLYMEREEARAVLYGVLGVGCLALAGTHALWTSLLGLVLVVTACIQVLAALSKRQDAIDGAAGGGGGSGTRSYSSSSATALLSEPQPYTFGASRSGGVAGAGAGAGTSSSSTSAGSGSFITKMFGGGSSETTETASGSFGTFNSREMMAEV